MKFFNGISYISGSVFQSVTIHINRYYYILRNALFVRKLIKNDVTNANSRLFSPLYNSGVYIITNLSFWGLFNICSLNSAN